MKSSLFTVVWMLVATTSFTLMAFLIKMLSNDFTVADILFIRSSAAVFLVLAIYLVGNFRLRTTALRIHIRRSMFGLFSMATWYYTLGVLPMGVSVTLNYMSPLFLSGILFFQSESKNRPSPWQFFYILIGLVGVMLMLNPFGEAMHQDNLIPICLGLLAAFVAALAFKDVKVLKEAAQNEWQMVFYFSLIAALISFPFTAIVRFQFHENVSLYGYLSVAGFLGAIGQFGVSKAFGTGNQIVAASLQYLSVIFSLLLAWAVLGETVSSQQLMGIVIVIFSALLTIIQPKLTH